MGKTEKTIYTCDRCKTVINGDAHRLGWFHYMHIVKWYCPVYGYKLSYLCNKCLKELKEFLNADRRDEGEAD